MGYRNRVEEEAKRRGVVLAAPASDAPAAPPVARSTGWLSNVMPEGAQLMADLKAQLPADLYAGILSNLKRGAGYVVDHSTRIGVGNPPLEEWERGKVQMRDGLAVMRVRPKGLGGASR